MTYFADGTAYDYGHEDRSAAVNVGWLGGSFPFDRGPTPDAFRARLANLCLTSSVNQMRGVHACELCAPDDTLQVWIRAADRRHLLGSAEIRVRGSTLYAAPNLVVHYVIAHDYLPPDDFVNTILQRADVPPAGWRLVREPW